MRSDHPLTPLLLEMACSLLAVALLAGEALAFRSVPVGSPMPAVTLKDLDGTPVELPPKGAPSVLLFFRAGQRYSTEALADIEAIRRAFGSRATVIGVAEAGTDPKALRALAAASRTGLRLLVDDPGTRYVDTLGVIVLPSTAVVSATGSLAAYFPGRSAHLRELVEARVRVLEGEITEADYVTRAELLGERGSASERAHALSTEAIAHSAKGEWEAARQALAAAIALTGDDLGLHAQLGFVLVDGGELVDAAKAFRFILARNPASPRARLGLGIVDVRQGRLDEGIARIEAALELNPDPTRGFYELGRAYEAKGDLARALRYYKVAVRKVLQGRS